MTKFYYDSNEESKHCLKAMYDMRKNKEEKDYGKDKVVFYEKDYAKNKCKCSKSYYN
ncbi:hypothetical protein P4629_25375 [Priestia aryabhattai]|uniref:hypothetical protein n=1 Tax=Priestia aryabhattai TaxID=412384 RepID=UPI002E1A21E3|nr:hypothetical protein [Priestia aryabhattai]